MSQNSQLRFLRSFLAFLLPLPLSIEDITVRFVIQLTRGHACIPSIHHHQPLNKGL